MSEVLVSIIVPVYNVSDYLQECWDSIISQSFKNLEIILVDDGSTDGSGELCDELSKQDKRVIVIHRKNGGLSAARNSGLDVCKGEYVTFVDSDDFIASNMIEKLVLAMSETGADIVQCESIRFENELDEKKTVDNHFQVKTFPGNVFVGNENYKDVSWAKLYKREVWSKKRFREGIIHEDYALTYKLIYESALVSHVGETLYYARIRPGSITQLGFRKESLILVELSEERIEYFMEYNDKRLLDYAYTGYYGYLLSFYNKLIKDNCLDRIERKEISKSLILKYRKNIMKFLDIESIGVKTKIKLVACFCIPSLWIVGRTR